MRLAQGLIVLPAGVDIVAFLRHDGVIPDARGTPVAPGELSLAEPRDRYIFAPAEHVERSKKRSRTTGHPWKDRPGAMRDRLAGVRQRERPGIMALTEDEAHDHLKRTLAGSEWEVMRGYHVLRHSLI